jgi:hypothetical protein
MSEFMAMGAMEAGVASSPTGGLSVTVAEVKQGVLAPSAV